MPRYKLDTYMCIYLMKNQAPGSGSALCAVSELEYGVSVSAEPERERVNLGALVEDNPIAPFDIPAGVACAIRLATRDSKKGHLGKPFAALEGQALMQEVG